MIVLQSAARLCQNILPAKFHGEIIVKLYYLKRKLRNPYSVYFWNHHYMCDCIPQSLWCLIKRLDGSSLIKNRPLSGRAFAPEDAALEAHRTSKHMQNAKVELVYSTFENNCPNYTSVCIPHFITLAHPKVGRRGQTIMCRHSQRIFYLIVFSGKTRFRKRWPIINYTSTMLLRGNVAYAAFIVIYVALQANLFWARTSSRRHIKQISNVLCDRLSLYSSAAKLRHIKIAASKSLYDNVWNYDGVHPLST